MFLQRLKHKALMFSLLSLGAVGFVSRCSAPAPLKDADFDALYANPAPAFEGPLTLYHLGHSLVGKDMPAMLAQLAGDGHSYNSQLGWGSFLREHWEHDVPVKGFKEANGHPEYRDPHEAMAAGDYEALVVTEAVEIRDAIKYFTPHYYLRKWATAAWAANPDTRVYLYETWHSLDDPEGWLIRLDRDLGRYWEGEILRRALAYPDVIKPIYVIPAGQVFARFVRAVEAEGGVGPITRREDLFRKRDDGGQDNIHFNDLGAYLVALTHYAVLYQRSPQGLPYQLKKADGSPAIDPGPKAAQLMQDIVWEVVTGYPPTGVRR